MIIVGITGGSGSGKTTVGMIFESFGFLYIDTDIIAREITEKGKPALLEIHKYFGNVFFEDGTLDRKALGKIVFSDSEKLEILNKITHKYITKIVFDRIKEAEKGENYGVIIDGAALIESGINKICDKTIFVTAKREVRLERIKERDNLSEKEASLRINGQKDDSFYQSNCDYTLDTTQGYEKLLITVEKIAKELKRG